MDIPLEGKAAARPARPTPPHPAMTRMKKQSLAGVAPSCRGSEPSGRPQCRPEARLEAASAASNNTGRDAKSSPDGGVT